MTTTTNTFAALIAQLDHDNKKKGDQGELLTKWFLENDPIYSSQLKHVWLWNDWPDCWGPDMGIDLVAETYDGKLWAIQAKAHAETTPVTMHHMSQFIAASSTAQFDHRLLVTFNDQLAANAKYVAAHAEKSVGVIYRADLEDAQLAWPASYVRFAVLRREGSA